MKKHYLKLSAAVAMLLVAATLMILSSYAWMVVSTAPVAEGLEVIIGGGNTILIAPDITETVDGVTYHYPGVFSDTLNFAQWDSYAYLSQLGGLTPVSTADGLTWYLPRYYSQAGADQAGQLMDFADFWEEKTLDHANLAADEKNLLQEGSYVYLDFWVVSPSEEFDLRVAKGTGENGTFVVSLPSVEQTDGKLHLGQGNAYAEASVRVGFLSNADEVLDSNAMILYSRSLAYSARYTKLLGVYQEPGYSLPASPATRFTIFEPNGDLHPGAEGLDGYLITQPLGPGGIPTDISSLLTVQLKNQFEADVNGSMLEQAFQTSIAGRDFTALEAESHFYRDYLQRQVGYLIQRGDFFTRTADLYAQAKLSGGAVPQADFSQLDISTVTSDTYITTLQRCTPQRIRMYIWLEGQDIDCVNAATGARLLVSIQLAGGSTQNQ